jgi:hypothetical protein
MDIKLYRKVERGDRARKQYELQDREYRATFNEQLNTVYIVFIGVAEARP